MTRVYIADALPEERAALRRLLLDLLMEVVGEAATWQTALIHAPHTRPDMLLVDKDLLPGKPGKELEKFRKKCQAAVVIVLVSSLDARQQAALSSGADSFISKGETPERVIEHLRRAAAQIST